MDNFTKNKKIVIIVAVIGLALLLGYRVLSNGNESSIHIEKDSQDVEEELFLDDEKSDEEIEETEGTGEILVHITGEISRPGVIALRNGDRIIDAIAEAGGFTSLADESKINLAQKLFDEDKINIPKIGDNLVEVDQGLNSGESQEGSSEEVVMRNTASSSSGGSGININTASKEELKTLPGIGDVTADKIIDYRESNKFGSIEDIKNVSGIGEKKFEAIEDMITTR